MDYIEFESDGEEGQEGAVTRHGGEDIVFGNIHVDDASQAAAGQPPTARADVTANPAVVGHDLGGAPYVKVEEPPYSQQQPSVQPPPLEVHHQVRLARGVPVAVEEDNRITVLFDLNGVLVKRKLTKKGRKLRNGVKHLRALAEAFRLGVYTSATVSTAWASASIIEAEVGVRGLFEVIMCRDQCVPAPEGHAGKPWDVIKPLAPSFPGARLERVVLVDDDAFKAVEGEERNMLLVPGCLTESDAADSKDRVLAELVHRLCAVADVADIRDCTADISAYLFSLSARQAAERSGGGGGGGGAASGATVSISAGLEATVGGVDTAARAPPFKTEPEVTDSGGAAGGSAKPASGSTSEASDDADLGEFHSAAGRGRGGKENAEAKPVIDCLARPSSPQSNEQQTAPAAVPSTVDVATVHSIPVPESDDKTCVGMCRLHNEIAAFVNATRPTAAETETVHRLLEEVGRAGRRLWHTARVALFGSQAHGLALPGSDLDIVVLGVTQNLRSAASGFTKHQQEWIGSLLQRLMKELKVSMGVRNAKVIKAKVPIIKCELRMGASEEYVAVDISMGVANGMEAAEFIAREIVLVPPLRPLVLVVKAFLRQKGLNEVFTGGLSSYCIFLLVLAHLQAERLVPVHGGDPPSRYPPLGLLLWTFFRRFGNQFNYNSQAVSVQQGGVVQKLKRWRSKAWMLAVEDPQEAGRDIGGGTFNIRVVRASFAAAAETLLHAAASSSDSRDGDRVEGGMATRATETAEERETRLWAAVQSEGQHSTTISRQHNESEADPETDGSAAAGDELRILGSLLDCAAEIRRGGSSASGRSRVEGSGKAEVARAAQSAGYSLRRSMKLGGHGAKEGHGGGGKGKRSVKSSVEEKMARLQGAAGQAQGGGGRGSKRPREEVFHDFDGPEQKLSKTARRKAKKVRRHRALSTVSPLPSSDGCHCSGGALRCSS